MTAIFFSKRVCVFNGHKCVFDDFLFETIMSKHAFIQHIHLYKSARSCSMKRVIAKIGTCVCMYGSDISLVLQGLFI